MLRNGVMPIPPARNTAGRCARLCNFKSPHGPSTSSTVPNGHVFKHRFIAVSRMRVANMMSGSCGALAIENARAFPSSSVSGGFVSFTSIACPALKSNPAGFSRKNCIVPSATSLRFFNFIGIVPILRRSSFACYEFENASLRVRGRRPLRIEKSLASKLLERPPRAVARTHITIDDSNMRSAPRNLALKSPRPVEPEHNSRSAESLSFTLHPVPPFRLDLTVWALRRRPENLLDRWDGQFYHRALAIGEQISSQPIEIAAMQTGSPERPALRVEAQAAHPSRELESALRSTVERMLGLNIDLRAFYAFAAKQKHLGPLISSLTGVKPPRYPTLFEALLNAISCQQVSLNVGIMLLNRVVENFGRPASSDDLLRACPQPYDLAKLNPGALHALGYSASKERAILELSRSIASGELDLESFRDLDDEAALERLTSLRGIGRWSAEYALLRGMGRLNIFPGDDVGGWNNLQKHLRLRSRPDYAKTRRLLAPWKNYAGLIYFHFLLDGLRSRGLIA